MSQPASSEHSCFAGVRRDALTGREVIVAPDRGRRPNEFDFPQAAPPEFRCPFCRGNEEQTPAPIATYGGGPAGADWLVRVVPNKYPALRLERQGDFATDPAPGAHEVVIESPRHVTGFSELTEQEAALSLFAWRDRLASLQDDDRLAAGIVFKNVGPAAGASIRHAHSQILATPFVPTAQREQLAAAAEYSRLHRRCAFCDEIEREIDDGSRIVFATSRWVIMCPFASRFAYEVGVYPLSHAARFDLATDHDLRELAVVLRDLAARIERVGGGAYNLVLQTAPFRAGAADHFHWHVQLFPRLSTPAGFELGGGTFINTVAPEEAAQVLQNI